MIFRVLAFVVFLFSFLNGNNGLKKISVQLEWKHQFEFAGFYAAVEKGYYKDIGLDVELKEYDSKTDIIEDVLKGKSTFGLSSSSLLLEKLKNKPVVLLASYFKKNVLALVTRKNITTLSQLKGKYIMATSYEMTHSSIGAMLQEAGLKNSDVNFVEHDFSIQKFKDGKVDAMSVFLTNQIYELDKQSVDYNVFVPYDFGLYSYDLELFTSENVVISDYKTVKDFIDATKKGWEYAFANKEEIIDLIYNKYSKRKSKEALLFEANETEKLFKTNIFNIGSVAPELLKLNYDMYEKLGLVEKISSMDSLIEEYLFQNKYSNLKKYDFTEEELSFLMSNPTIKVGNEKNFPPYNYLFNNSPQGFSIDYIDFLASKIGLNLEYETDNWNDILEKVKEKKIDIILNIAKTQNRKKYLEYTGTPYIKGDLVFVGNEKTPDGKYKTLDDLNGKKIAVVRGFFEEELLKRYYPLIKLEIVEDSLEALKLVSFGKVEGSLFDLFDVAQYYMHKYSITNVKPLFEVKDKRFGLDLFIASHKDNKILISILQKIQNNLNENEVLKLKNKTLNYGSKEKSFLSIHQYNYLKKNNVIKMCNNPDFAPIEFYENESQNSKPLGFAIDLLGEMEKVLNIKFEHVPTKDWKESQEFLKQKKCDILPCAVRTDQRSEFALFTKPYLSLDLAVITKKNKPYINAIEDIFNKKISIKQSSGLVSLVGEKYNNLDIVKTKDTKEAFLDVEQGKSYATVSTLPVAYNIMQKYGLNDLQVSGYMDAKYNLSIAVRDDKRELLDILDTALNNIEKTKIKQIFDKWSSIEVKQQGDFSFFYRALLFMIILLIIFIYWNSKLSFEKKKAKEAMQEAKDANRSKSEFLANMSHEIRTPMNAIAGFLQLLKKTELTVDQEIYISKINGSSQILLSIINDILDYSKVEAGKLSLEHINFNLKRTIQNVFYNVELKAIEKELEIIFEYDESLGENFTGDPLRISQVLTNLLNNAVKFTFKGKVQLKVYQSLNGKVRFEIADTGIGISKENQEKLFKSFSQADGSITREYGGSGLGLAISKKLIKLMQGDIWLESKENIGSRFIFEIPLIPVSVEGTNTFFYENNNDKESSIRGSLLVVEDNKINQEIIVGLLSNTQIKIDIACDGIEALEKFKDKSNNYDLILMDIQMPKMDGYTAAFKIRQLDKEIPIVAISANVVDESYELSLDAGMNDHINKPIEFNRLFEVLNKYLKHNKKNKDFKHLDTQTALLYLSNNERIYLKILNDFLKAYKDFSLKDLSDEDFKIAVHTLKGLSATIGANKLHEVVKKLNDTKDKTLLPLVYEKLKEVIKELETKL